MQKKSAGTFAKTGNLFKYEETAGAGAAGTWGRYSSVRCRGEEVGRRGRQTRSDNRSPSAPSFAPLRPPALASVRTAPSADLAHTFFNLQVLKGHELSVFAGESKVRKARVRARP